MHIAGFMLTGNELVPIGEVLSSHPPTEPVASPAPTEPSPGPPPIDCFNKFQVCPTLGDIQLNVGRRLTPDEALNLAAWLVALAQPAASHDFQEVFELVRERARGF